MASLKDSADYSAGWATFFRKKEEDAPDPPGDITPPGSEGPPSYGGDLLPDQDIQDPGGTPTPGDGSGAPSGPGGGVTFPLPGDGGTGEEPSPDPGGETVPVSKSYGRAYPEAPVLPVSP